MSKDTSGSAFPYRDEQGDGCYIQHFGLTKREWYAAMASDSDIAAQIPVLRVNSPIGILPDNYVAIARFMHADAMIAEGSKQ